MAKTFNDALQGNFAGPVERSPEELLKELASSLRQKMKYQIGLDVVSGAGDGRVVHTVRATIDRLDYILDLLSVSHEVLQLYPARLSGMLVAATTEVQTEDELFDVLVRCFNSKKAETTLGTLLKQA